MSLATTSLPSAVTTLAASTPKQLGPTKPELILCAVRWYLRYSLSLRDVERIARP